MNLDELKNASCYEELELLLILQALQGKRKKVFNALANYRDDIAFCIPTKVGFVWYSKNSLKRVEAPKKVDKDFDCSSCNSLTSLEGTPREVNGNFYCLRCKSLTSLTGSPEKVNGHFNCSYCNSLTSLEGALCEINGSFCCLNCKSLTSLMGAPKKVYGIFNCSYCPSLASLEGAPEKVGGDFYCVYCTSLPKSEVEKLRANRKYKLVLGQMRNIS